MKILSDWPQAPSDRRQAYSSNDGTDFQQLVQDLEKSMWSGARAGSSGVGAKVATAAVPQHAEAPWFTPSAVDKPAPWPLTTSNIAELLPLTAYAARLPAEINPLMAVTPATAQDNKPDTPPATTPISTPTPIRDAEANDETQARREFILRAWPEMPTEENVDCVNLLPGIASPAVVVRHVSQPEHMAPIRRAMQEELRRHGIYQASLIINGLEYPSHIENGTDYGN